MTSNILDEVKIKHLDSTEFVSGQNSVQQLHFPLILKMMTDCETKEYHLKKFAEWGKKWEQECKAELIFGVDGNIYRNGNLLAEEPNFWQKQWFNRRMRVPIESWRRGSV